MNAAPTSRNVKRFQKLVLGHFQKAGRDLPWRRTRDPYRILLSEIMLQQTQVERVIPFYERFFARFPDVTSLSRASFAEVYEYWKGLGYNRRAKALRDLAEVIVREHGGAFPSTAKALEELPGVGRYTAAAVAAFAFSKRVILIETNIRTVYLHHFFSGKGKVDDKSIEPLIERTLPDRDFARWYAALMDYGAHLKKNGVKLNSRSRSYVRQKPFKNSTRKLRGEILRRLSESEGQMVEKLRHELGAKAYLFRRELQKLKSEGLIVLERAHVQLA